MGAAATTLIWEVNTIRGLRQQSQSRRRTLPGAATSIREVNSRTLSGAAATWSTYKVNTETSNTAATVNLNMNTLSGTAATVSRDLEPVYDLFLITSEFTLSEAVGKTDIHVCGVFVKQVIFLTVNHCGPLPLRELHSTDETIVWRDPGGS